MLSLSSVDLAISRAKSDQIMVDAPIASEFLLVVVFDLGFVCGLVLLKCYGGCLVLRHI